jgi:hypothetical protein
MARGAQPVDCLAPVCLPASRSKNSSSIRLLSFWLHASFEKITRIMPNSTGDQRAELSAKSGENKAN